MVQANEEIQENCPNMKGFYAGMFIIGVLLFCFFSAAYVLIRHNPYLGTLLIWALCFGIFFYIYRHGDEINTKYGSALDRFFGNTNKGMENGLDAIILIMLLMICGSSIMLATFLDNENKKIQQDALVQSSMESAPSGSMTTWCVAGKTYIRGSKGEIIALEVNGKPLECTTAE